MRDRSGYSPENEHSQVEQERINFLLRALKVGLRSAAIIGYHGTSIEAVQESIKTGRFPVSSVYKNEEDIKGNFYFFPRENLISHTGIADDVYLEHDKLMIKDASSYAEIVAGRHHLAKLLGVDLSNREDEIRLTNMLHGHMEDVDEDDVLRLLAGKSKRDLAKMIAESIKMKGVVIGIGKSALGDGGAKPASMLPGYEGDDGWFINFSKGMDLLHVAGLKLLSKKEKDFFENLRKESRYGI